MKERSEEFKVAHWVNTCTLLLFLALVVIGYSSI